MSIFARMGMAVVGAYNTHSELEHKATMDRIQQDYANTMSALSASQQFNTITENEIAVRDASTRASMAIEVQSMKDTADAQTSAAVLGVKGQSVKSAIRGLVRSKLQARHANHQRHKAQMKASGQQRRNTELARVMNKEISPITSPSVGSTLLGLGASLIDIYDTNTPD